MAKELIKLSEAKVNGKNLVAEYISSMAKGHQVKYDARMASVRAGNLGKINSVGEGVHEFKFKFGLRVYYGYESGTVILLLCAGDKGSQKDDIKLAKEIWKAYRKG